MRALLQVRGQKKLYDKMRPWMEKRREGGVSSQKLDEMQYQAPLLPLFQRRGLSLVSVVSDSNQSEVDTIASPVSVATSCIRVGIAHCLEEIPRLKCQIHQEHKNLGLSNAYKDLL